MEPVCVDILYLVFELLSPSEYQALCLVNKHFQTIAEPLLYSKIQFTWQKKHDYYSNLEAPPPITQLLRTLLSKPQLAAHITSLHLDGKAYVLHDTRFKLPKIHIPKNQLYELIMFIHRTGVPYRDWWSRELHDGSVDALVALLLAQLSSLKYLHLGHAFTRQSVLIGIVLRLAICEPGTYKLGNFQRLQELSFFHRESRDEACDRKIKNTVNILPFFYLPNLQHVSASIENPDKWAWLTSHAPVLPKLKSLDLTNIREGYLGEILAVTKNLQTLRWKWYYDSGVEDDFITQTVDLDQIAAALSHVQGTLTDLAITADCQPAAAVGDQFFPGLEAVGSLRALVNFDQIKTLQIPLAFLVGFAQDRTKRLQDVIPRNVEFLIITDDLALQNMDNMEEEWPAWEWKDYAILGLLESWLREWTRWTPYLSRITLLLSWIDTDTNQWSPRAREQLWGLSAQTGIPLEFVNTEHQL
ncbi:hypothetical protein BDV29DRAFT_201671 [Aspergillus leporis]|uniref:F-box domain-containing protein n=1 Tax=Aspergillus leporis TaxID=41062 RepID=A0A5N5X2N5_9EURO|nr:hypothetical protein BDV29DRAFT_201671 [Aspergillus leporis]